MSNCSQFLACCLEVMPCTVNTNRESNLPENQINIKYPKHYIDSNKKGKMIIKHKCLKKYKCTSDFRPILNLYYNSSVSCCLDTTLTLCSLPVNRNIIILFHNIIFIVNYCVTC